MVTLFARATRRVSVTHIRHVAPVSLRAATGLTARVYRQMEADFGMVAPPVMLHAPAPDTLAACWSILRETMLAPGLVDRSVKEAVAAAVSLANQCPYCVEVHGAALAGLVRGPDALAVAVDRAGDITDPGLRELARWARASGNPSAQARHPAPFPPAQAPELIGVAVTFHYINRMVNVFLRDSPMPPAPTPVLRVVRRVAARLMRDMASRHSDPGRSGDLLPDAPLAADLAWAAGPPHIAGAVARAAAAVDAGGARSVPERVRRLVVARIADRTPEPAVPRSDPRWESAVAELPDDERPAARLALLTALASYRVTDAVIGDFRAQGHDDRATIELTSWASFAAARQIGAELHRDLAADPETR
ncbi:carboxymuconolactone decarboxylase family protein [Micromonospora schwarzwaldensis]|uniref:carboxymuconolactone decarboxylase family protein n=1 Tax=Micromonospora sp. DSM 45708 TaxID=3111767 RepID=UPI0031DB83FE